MTDRTSPLALRLAGTDDTVRIRPKELVIAGYTGSDRASIEAHIAELAANGVPPPASVPAFFRLDPALISTAPRIRVGSEATSGEVEPVLIKSANAFYLGVGSDHTDRDLERKDVAAAKNACAKALGTTVVPFTTEFSLRMWHRARASCWSDGHLYQAGALAQMLPPLRIWNILIERLDEITSDAVVFLGTLPLIVPEFRYGKRWEVELAFPDGPVLRHSYDVLVDRP